jgi:hypothetical protein
MDNGSLAVINPKQDLEVMHFYEEAQRLQKYAEERVITTLEDTKLATNDLSMIAKLKKAMETKRKDYSQPFQEHVKFINETYKTLMLPVEQADIITRQKMSAYMQEQERKQREQEEINRLRMEAAQKEAALNNGEIKESVNLVDVVEAPKKVISDAGSVGTMKVRKFEVEDITKVPIEYLKVDEVAIGKLVRAGIKSISGIRIWEEDTLKVNTK